MLEYIFPLLHSDTHECTRNITVKFVIANNNFRETKVSQNYKPCYNGKVLYDIF